MSDSLISIIVPVYNSEQTLNRCIDSILGQTYRNFELLLINDGSKDRSGEICDEYARKDSRVKVFHKENGGVSSARNVGLDNASGEWITFVDSDDRIGQNFLKNLVLYSTNVDLVIGPYVCESSDIRESSCIPEGLYDNVNSFLSNWISNVVLRSPWGKLLKKSLIASLRFDIKLQIGEDSVFMFTFYGKVISLRVVSQYEDASYEYRLPYQYLSEKYSMTAKSAANHLCSIIHAYEALRVTSREFEMMICSLCYDCALEDIKRHPAIWYGNNEVKRILLSKSFKFGVFPWLRTWLSCNILHKSFKRSS